MAQNVKTALYIVSCDDADAMFAVYADSKRDANNQVVALINSYAGLESHEGLVIPDSVKRILEHRDEMPRKKVGYRAMLKSEPQFEVVAGVYSITGD